MIGIGMGLHGKKIHFMGIGGIGMSALARLAAREGATVSGCDREASDLTDRLITDGIPVLVGHAADHVADVDLLVHTSAVPSDHPELEAARETVRRGQLLADFMSGQTAWGVSGTHGKTTTSWLTARILIAAGWDPTVFIGGIVPELEYGNIRMGNGPFVAELDESDGSFLLPRLDVAIVTNIESDHLSYYGTDDALFAAFRTYAANLGPDSLLVASMDNAESRRLYVDHRGAKVSFGIADVTATFRAVDIADEPDRTRFRLLHGDRDLGQFSTLLPGRYNVLNCLAAAAAAITKGVPVDTVRQALAEAGGVDRRMERLGTVDGKPDGAVVYSDYAHHPTEVSAAIGAFRLRHNGPTLVVFQPHLYSRTRDYARDFAAALAGADDVLLVDIYPAREEPIPGVTSDLIRGFLPDGAVAHGPVALDRVVEETRRLAAGREAVIMMGAGTIDAVARVLASGNGKGG
ncbi:MAG: UDP-N-acetylmuramate--L-alanine ligase [Planctomycetes bacterium]|nr:UDP-N-acetylmuramate--L-alanine ligase [Planctomycetota bacterium]